MGFHVMAWGIVFVLLSFQINGIDILPDIIGYILMLIGFSRIESYHPHFRRGKLLSIVFIVLSLIGMFQIRWTNPDGVLLAGGLLLSLVILVLQVMLFYSLIMGIEEVSRLRGKLELADLARGRWKLYLFYVVAIAISMLIIWSQPLLFGPFIAILAFMFSIVLTYLLCALCTRTEREWTT